MTQQVITLDMDGTLYDPWHCCGHRDESKTGTEKCRHIRDDIRTEVLDFIASHPDALIAVLSWRGDYSVEPTRTWLIEHVGITPDFIFMPYSPDEEAHILVDQPYRGQVHFKREAVGILHDSGYEVIASWDDNAEVIEALAAEGVPHARRVPRLVRIPRDAWGRGYLDGVTPPKGALFDWDDDVVSWDHLDNLEASLPADYFHQEQP